jgi:hypothetical protein
VLRPESEKDNSSDTIDCEDVDPHGCDDACGAVDFDAFGNEIDQDDEVSDDPDQHQD